MAIKVPPGQSPPFETIDKQHRAGVIIITAAICLVISLVSLAIRAYVRVFLRPPWGSDDIILLVATISAITESIIVFYSASVGLGTDTSLLDQSVVNRIQDYLVTVDTLYLLTLYLSKCCTIAIYHRLTPCERHKDILWGLLGLSTLWIIASMVIIAVGCENNKSWVTSGGSCHDLFARWQAISAVDISIELFLFLFCFALICGLQMGISDKTTIIVCFAARLPLIIFSTLRLSRIRDFTKSENPTFSAISYTVFTQVQLNYALVACTSFCMQPFMKAVTTYYGTACDPNFDFGNSHGHGNGHGGPAGRRSAAGRSQDFEMNEVNPVHECHMLSSLGKDGTGLEIFRTESDGDGSTRTILRENSSCDYPKCSDSVSEMLSQDSCPSISSQSSDIQNIPHWKK